MKWNILVGSMVLGASLCGQSFGGDLLHRLLGGHGCGAKSSCCDTSVCDPSCGAEIAACDPCGKGPSCGAEIASCDPCGAAPSCGAEIASCDPCGTTVCVRTPVLDKLRNLKAKLIVWKQNIHAKHAASCGCEQADPCGPSCGAEIAACDPCGKAPTCGAEIAACDPCAAPSCDGGCGRGKRHIGLLSKLFKHKSGCDVVACDAIPTCGCGATAAPSAAPAAAPAAPAPVVDPHAYMNTNRRVIQASSTRVR